MSTPAVASVPTKIEAGAGSAAFMQLGLGFWASKTFLTAVELGIFTELARGPLTLDALVKRFELHGRGAQDFFDALVSFGVLERDEAGSYSNTPDGARFLDKNQPTYIGGILEMANARLYGSWGRLTTALRTGLPQNESPEGGNPFDTFYADPKLLRLFLSGMTGLSLAAGSALAGKLPWSEYRSAVDIGCAQGAVPVQLALAHEHLHTIGFDLPPVEPVFREYTATFGLNGRARFHAGNFFQDPLPTADVMIMGHILHDWDLPTKRMLLAKAYDALPKAGTLVVYEVLIDDERRTNAFGLLASLNMLIETPGGFDFTGADCRGWMHDAGFRETRVEPLFGVHSMVVGTK